MKYKKIIYLIIGIILLASSYLLVQNNFVKIFAYISGLFNIFFCIGTPKKIKTVLKYTIIIAITILIDYALVFTTDLMPIYSIKFKVSDNTNIYKAISYRTWDCDGYKILDQEINESFLCNNIELYNNDSNIVVHELVKEDNDYYNQYIKISGKVSRIISNSQIELRTYIIGEETLNGYVEFSEDLIYRFNFNNENSLLDKYHAYDFITIIAQVDTTEYIDNQTIINFKNSSIELSNLYDNYEFVVTSKEICEDDENNILLISDTEKDIYNYCLDSIVVKYNEELIYDFSYLLQLNKLNIEDVLKKSESENEINNNIQYNFKDFTIIKCQFEEKNKYIIGSNSLNLEDKVCTNITE